MLDDVNCEGSESTLLSCSHGGINQQDCGPFAVAGVICGGILYVAFAF